MLAILLLFVGISYIGIGLIYLTKGNTGLGIAFISYAVANIGIFISGTK